MDTETTKRREQAEVHHRMTRKSRRLFFHGYAADRPFWIFRYIRMIVLSNGVSFTM